MPTLPKNIYEAFMKQKHPRVYEETRCQQKVWDKTMAGRSSVSTEGVKPNKLNKLYKQLKSVCEKPVCVTIDEQLLSCACYQNTEFVEMLFGWKCQAGFNIVGIIIFWSIIILQKIIIPTLLKEKERGWTATPSAR